MLKYLYRTCPKCKDYLGVVIRDPPESKREVPIDAHCVVCGFKLDWKVVLGDRHLKKTHAKGEMVCKGVLDSQPFYWAW